MKSYVYRTGITKQFIDDNESAFKDLRTSDILRMRLRGLTFKEIAQKFGLTKERIRQIEAKGVEILVNIAE